MDEISSNTQRAAASDSDVLPRDTTRDAQNTSGEIQEAKASGEVVKRKAGRPKGVKRAAKKLTQAELANMVVDYARGVPQTEIAKKNGVSDMAVSLILKKFEPIFEESKNVNEYRQVKSTLIDAAALSTLKLALDPERQASATLRDVAYTYDVLNKASRLEQGMSTANTDTRTQTFAFIQVETA